MRMRRLALLTAPIFLSAAIAGRAHAQGIETPVEVRGCDASDAMVSAIRVELAAAGASMARVTVVCLEGSRVLVVAFPVATDRPGVREVDTADVTPEARTRAVAIATGEMLRAMAGRDAPSPSPAPPVPAEPVTPAIVAPLAPIVVQVTAPSLAPARAPSGQPSADGEAAAWSVGAALRVRAFAEASTFVVGPALQLEAGLGDLPLRLRVGTDLGRASDTAPEGETSLVAWTGSAALLGRAQAGPIHFDAGPFLELGGAFAEGTSASDATASDTTVATASGSGPIAMIGGEAFVGAKMADHLEPFVALDAGAVLAGLQADIDDRASLSIAGPFVGVRLGLAILP